MMRHRLLALMVALSGLALFAGCATSPSYDYSAYQAHPPRSILVLPPINKSVDVHAPYVYLASISEPLAEHGYYVFPVAVVDNFMKSNGVTEPAEMQQVPLKKLKSVFDPDAVLYTTIDDWGQKYHVLSSDTTVELTSRLVDADNGETLWRGHQRVVQSSNQGSSSLLADAIVALVQQIAGATHDYTFRAATQANTLLFDNQKKGLPYGPYNPKSETDSRRLSTASN